MLTQHLLEEAEGQKYFSLEARQAKDAIETDSFVYDGKAYSFFADIWDFSESVNTLFRERSRPYCIDFKLLDGDAAIAVKCWILSQLCPVSSVRHVNVERLKRKSRYLAKSYADIGRLYGTTGFLSPSMTMIQHFMESQRGLQYSTICAKSHIYADFLVYVQEVFGVGQNNEGLKLLQATDAKKINATTAANIRKPVNPVYLGKLKDLCVRALTNKGMEEEDRIVSAVLLLLIYTGRRIGEVLHTEIQTVQHAPYGDSSIPYIMMPLEKRALYTDGRPFMDVTYLAPDALAAYEFLVVTCLKYRKQRNTTLLISFPGRNALRDCIKKAYFRFVTRYSRQLDAVNAEERYPGMQFISVSGIGKYFGKKEPSFLAGLSQEERDRTTIAYATFHQFRKSFATRKREQGFSVEDIAKQLGHSDPMMTEEYYIHPEFSKEKIVKKRTVFRALQREFNVLGAKNTERFTDWAKKQFDSDELCICEDEEEVLEYMACNMPLQTKEVGFCLLSGTERCTERPEVEQMMCAYYTCSNIGFFFFDVAEHYKWFHDRLEGAKLNAAKGLVNAAECEENRALWIAKRFISDELPELEAEIERHGKEKIIEWYPDLRKIIENLARIKEEINRYISSKG